MCPCCFVDKEKLWIIVEKADLPKEVILAHPHDEINCIYFFESQYSQVTYQLGSNPSENIQMKNLTKNKVEKYLWEEKWKTSELPIARQFILGSY